MEPQKSQEHLYGFKGILTILYRWIKSILKYPFEIKKNYENYNQVINSIELKLREGRRSHEEIKPLQDLKKRNVLFIHIFIVLPLLLSISITSLKIYSNIPKYQQYFYKVSAPLRANGFFDRVGKSATRVYYSVKHQPVSLEELSYLLYGYLFVLGGAVFMARNPIFKRQKRIQRELVNKKFTDEFNNPWIVIWTPNYLYFDGYNCEPESFVAKKTFWNDIDFQPAEPIIYPEKVTRFIVPRKYELGFNIEFKFAYLSEDEPA